jgi:DNA-binding transcriptional regulator YiaG
VSNASQNRDFRMRFKAARQGVGFTLQDLADESAQSEHAVDLDTLTAWENGKEAPREWEREAIETLEVTLGAEGTLTEALGW